jgi:prolyl-tRNA synthetase
VIVLNLGPKDEASCRAAEGLYNDLRAEGLDVLYDDRDERPGSKFNDADLLGIPYRLTVGKTFEKEGKVELRSRKTGETEILALDTAVGHIAELVRQALNSINDEKSYMLSDGGIQLEHGQLLKKVRA